MENNKKWDSEEHSLAEALAAAEKGDKEAMFDAVMKIQQTGYCDDEDIQQLLVKYLTTLSDDGEAVCTIMLAGYYKQGKGVPKDIGKAMELYEQAAKEGYVFAFECIGLMYYNGKDVSKDYKKAWDYFKKSHNEKKYYGSSPCTWYAIGEMYRNGWQVKQNLKKAEEYYDLALDFDNAEMDDYFFPALFQKARLVLGKEATVIDLDETINWVWKVKEEYNKSEDDSMLHECVTKAELDETLEGLLQAKEDASRSMTITLNKPMTNAEFEEQILKVLPTLRPIEYEHLIVELNYKHPWGISFIQTACMDDEDDIYCLELGHYEPAPKKSKSGIVYSKLYRREPEDEVGIREVVDAFRQVILCQGKLEMSLWSDVTKECCKKPYIMNEEDEVSWLFED